MKPSSIPFLFLLECAFLIWCARSALRPRQAMAASIFLSLGLLTWGCFSAWFAISGFYDQPDVLATFPGVWLPMVPLTIIGLSLLLFPFVRRGIVDIAVNTPHHRLIAIQALRILAIGTLLKAAQNVFPVHVELAIGITDLAFGIAALALYGTVKAGRLSSDAIVMFHAVGALLILLPGQLAIQTGLPGPFQEFREFPTSEVMLDFPMVLAPSLVVMIFVSLNILGMVAALKQGEAKRRLAAQA